jgi:hypothetical protein
MPPGVGVVLNRLYFGRFLPAGWLEWCGATYAVPVSYTAPGAANAAVDVAAIERRDDVSGWGAAIAPAISPVLSPRIAGQDATLDPTVPVSTTPTLTWTAPATGAPTAYVVEVWRLDASGPDTVRTLVLHHVTAATKVTVPPGVLRPGAAHYARIRALSTTAPVTVAPYRRANVFSSADALTGTFTP